MAFWRGGSPNSVIRSFLRYFFFSFFSLPLSFSLFLMRNRGYGGFTVKVESNGKRSSATTVAFVKLIRDLSAAALRQRNVTLPFPLCPCLKRCSFTSHVCFRHREREREKRYNVNAIRRRRLSKDVLAGTGTRPRILLDDKDKDRQSQIQRRRHCPRDIGRIDVIGVSKYRKSNA